jgi:hypothetical protein
MRIQGISCTGIHNHTHLFLCYSAANHKWMMLLLWMQTFVTGILLSQLIMWLVTFCMLQTTYSCTKKCKLEPTRLNWLFKVTLYWAGRIYRKRYLSFNYISAKWVVTLYSLFESYKHYVEICHLLHPGGNLLLCSPRKQVPPKWWYLHIRLRRCT